jgi:tryptophanyl-tRNA synthetase
MAADILLYNTDAVPVGDDQVQHVELTRTLAQRFNRDYGQVFKVPEAAVRKQGARIMGLDDPTKKMSKSASSPANYIALTDAPETAAKKIMRAVTDSGSEIKFDQKKKPAISNLMTIYSLLSDTSIKELEKKYQGKGYGDFKKDLAEVVKEFLTEFQIKYNSFADDDVKQILKDGAEKIRPIAEATLEKAKKNLGIN